MFDPYQLADQLESDFPSADVENVNDANCEVQARYRMENGDWGLSGQMYRLLQSHDACIVDFSGVTPDEITLHIGER